MPRKDAGIRPGMTEKGKLLPEPPSPRPLAGVYSIGPKLGIDFGKHDA
ncbi:hypothetical protein EDC90_1002173 [Martelella mediterranea]|uniref:Uncharacterized protein n=1 Tax=Martelella mediterranea TaxID=293089 RepID=A0A4R3NYW4_9HYPH|nr:hypothetical protein EDC90_1002173 [Martelella mediterranea]